MLMIEPGRLKRARSVGSRRYPRASAIGSSGWERIAASRLLVQVIARVIARVIAW